MKNIFATQETDKEEEHDTAVQLTTATKKKSKPRQRRKTDMKRVTCFNCGRKGHYAGTLACLMFKKNEDNSGSDDVDEDGN